MANIKGTNVASPVVPFTEADLYPTHEAKYGKGGYRTVQTIAERDSIPQARREEGMLVYVVNDPESIHTYQLINGSWVRNTIARGLPIYNNELLDQYGIDPNTTSYISVPDERDLTGSIEENTIKTSINGTYIDILFQSIRQLQAEVARLRNSMRYGLESYTEKATAMSTTMDDLENATAEEPIWAIDESSLSQIDGFTFELGDSGASELSLEGDSRVEVAVNPETSNSYLIVSGTATWRSNKSIRSVGDNKLYIYSTLLSLGESIVFDEVNPETGNPKESNTALSIRLSSLNMSYISEKNLYNTIVIVSRKDDEDRGQNFIWIHINDPYSDKTCAEGYYNPETGNLSDNVVELDRRYTIMTIDFIDTTLYKFKLYSKMQDFSHDVIASKPSEDDYKYKVAHITIRSVSSQKVLNEIKEQLLENELIWEESNKRLWIKSGYKLVPVGTGGSSGSEGGNEDTEMNKEELISTLKEMGIVVETQGENDYELSLNDVSDITFIHQGSGKRFKFEVNSEGNLQGQEVAEISRLLKSRESLRRSELVTDGDIRGFIGQLHGAEDGLASNATNKSSDYRLAADRLKIGAFYAPFSNDTVHGCSHSYVELENTSDRDIPLTGCYLHFTHPRTSSANETFHLPLTGVIKAGSTYLIRGAQHADPKDNNVYIKVNTFDQEWWENGELVSFEVNEGLTYNVKAVGYGFALTYGNENLSHDTQLIFPTADGQTIGTSSASISLEESDLETFPYTYHYSFIDSIYYYKACQNGSDQGLWAKNNIVPIKSNTLYKNTFELDPAKQAFQGLNEKDCSRERWKNADTDYQVVDLSKEFITFPHSKYKYATSNYTPKASFEKRNVSTDKTKLDVNKPNMVTCAFGIDIYKTRTFNWISLGYYDEYVWIRESGKTNWIADAKKCQSYLPYHEAEIMNVHTTVSSGVTSYEIAIKITTQGFVASANNLLENFSTITNSNHQSPIRGLTYEYRSVYTAPNNAGTFNSVYVFNTTSGSGLSVENKIFLHHKEDALDSKKYFEAKINNNIYARMTGRFPGDGSFYTAHKVIVDIVPASVGSPKTYEYIVGRPNKDGSPDLEHCSDIQTFTLYPTTYATRIYQITDQQGFTWIEYQAWAAAAEALKTKIASDKSQGNIIPILINSGDMTQNGTRINEWYDYYTAGSCLFDHLEQMNVVGNNDLCGPDPEELGTGDDPGKSNAYYFHIFYCYEVNPSVFTPLLQSYNGISLGDVPKYIPSLYYFDSNTDRFLMVNSEITETTCKTWYNVMTSSNSDAKAINVYTGFSVAGHNNVYYANDWTTIYTMIYDCLSDASTNLKKTIVCCHEMPFTVITTDSLVNAESKTSRSLSNKNALVGSHLNQISKGEAGDKNGNTPKGIYWFTRLIEHFDVKLVIGGHKHTYACTYPLRENYRYIDEGGSERSSKDNGKMSMSRTLQNDTISLYDQNMNDLSKRPLAARPAKVADAGATSFYPVEGMGTDMTGGIVYFMCQATGYKQTSNKELPSPDQEFSMIVSKTADGGKADSNQKYPMFGVIDVNNGAYTVKLARIKGIMQSGKFTQWIHSTDTPSLQWIKPSTDGTKFGSWVNDESAIITI